MMSASPLASRVGAWNCFSADGWPSESGLFCLVIADESILGQSELCVGLCQGSPGCRSLCPERVFKKQACLSGLGRAALHANGNGGVRGGAGRMAGGDSEPKALRRKVGALASCTEASTSTRTFSSCGLRRRCIPSNRSQGIASTQAPAAGHIPHPRARHPARYRPGDTVEHVGGLLALSGSCATASYGRATSPGTVSCDGFICGGTPSLPYCNGE